MENIRGRIVSIKLKLSYLLSNLKSSELKQYKNKKKIIYCLVPIHGNMGDQAIAYATRKYLMDNFKEYEILEFERDEIYKYGLAIKKILNEDDLIVLHGGGNMGNLYIKEEEPRRFIIDKFKGNKIISMTQTITFTDTIDSKEQKEKTISVYNSHPSLTLLAREDKSYKTMKEFFKHNKIIEVPDIVFYLEDLFSESKERKFIMTCLRADKESYYKSKKDEFLKLLRKEYSNLFESDTVIDAIVTKETREDELFKMWNNFRSAKVVITDRLHGMIFATITKTPCIVLRSLDHKVIESYRWVDNLNYIRFVEELNIDNIKALVDELSCLKKLDKTNFKEKYFKNLKSELVKLNE